MKKTFLWIISALALGSLFGYIFFKEKEEEIEQVWKESENLSFFQVGVFSNLENADNFSKVFNYSITLEEDGYYRVYLAILKEEENIDKLKTYLELNQIDYYVKNETINNNELLKYLSEMELLIKETMDADVMMEVNKNILQKYEELIK